MDLYLVQHGEAKSKDEDPERPLNDAGRAASETCAQQAVAQGVAVAEIRHSGKARAAQTAEIIAARLQPEGGVRAVEGLAPNDDVVHSAAELAASEDSLMLVGHLPHLAKLAGLLIAGDPDVEVVAFDNAKLIHLHRGDEGWQVISG